MSTMSTTMRWEWKNIIDRKKEKKRHITSYVSCRIVETNVANLSQKTKAETSVLRIMKIGR